MAESEKVFYVGVDWGAERHQVCILDAAGAVVGELSVAHQGAAVQALCERLLAAIAPLQPVLK